MNEGCRIADKKVQAAGYDAENYFHPFALVQTDKIGKGNLLYKNIVIGSYCAIGGWNVFYLCSHVALYTYIGNLSFMAILCLIAGHVTVGCQCFFENNSSNKDKIRIADKTLIGAGAYIYKDTEPESFWVPNRAICLRKKFYEIR